MRDSLRYPFQYARGAMTLNSNPTKTPSYCESGRLAQGGKHAFSFRSCEIYGLRERSINSPEVGPDSVRLLFAINSARQNHCI